MKNFNEIFIDKTKYGIKIQTAEYEEKGKHIIIDQGQSQIAGYTNREDGLFQEVPVVIFGDHTRVIKYVDEPFFLGADGVKVLRSKDNNANYKYLYYALRNAKIPDTGYNRHFKWLKEVQINYPDREKQNEIVEILDRVSGIIQIKQEELAHLDNLIQARFVEMFGDPVVNDKEQEIKSLDDLISARFVEMFGDPLDKKIANMIFADCLEFNPKKSEVKDLQDIQASFVPMECIGTDGSFAIKDKGIIREYYKGYTYFRDGDVLLAKITPCFENGKVAIAENCENGIGFGTTEFHVLRPRKDISNSYWIKYLLINERVHELATMNMSGSAGQKRIQTPFFEKLRIYLPPIELQNQFADFVRATDKLKLATSPQTTFAA